MQVFNFSCNVNAREAINYPLKQYESFMKEMTGDGENRRSSWFLQHRNTPQYINYVAQTMSEFIKVWSAGYSFWYYVGQYEIVFATTDVKTEHFWIK